MCIRDRIYDRFLVEELLTIDFAEALADIMSVSYTHLGYMLSFNFNEKKEIGVRDVCVGDKKIVEAVV